MLHPSIFLELAEKKLTNNLTLVEQKLIEEQSSLDPTFKIKLEENVLFLKQLNYLQQRNDFKSQLNYFFNGHKTLKNKKSALILNFLNFNKFRKLKNVAAVLITFLGVASICFILFLLIPQKENKQLEKLGKEIENIKKYQLAHSNLINEFKSKLPENAKYLTGGSGFLIDKKGYLITNAHILKGNGAIVVNEKGQELNAIIYYKNIEKDIAILKINDEDYIAPSILPYKIVRDNVKIGEEVFSLSFPRNNPNLVYTKGYIGAVSGYNDDSLTYQIQINAYQGNSGSPIFNKKGELIGILTSKESQTESIAFAIKTTEIIKCIKNLALDTTKPDKINIPNKNTLDRIGLQNQILALKNYIYNVKSYKN